MNVTVLNSIDVIVPVYRCVELATRCLDSIAEHIHEISECDPRVLIINDSPGDDDVALMLKSFASRHSYVTVLENERNLGFVRTVNRGLAIARQDGRDVILINADTETFRDTLKNLVSAAEADSQVGFVSPRSNNASFCSLPHFHGGVLADQTESYKRWKALSRTMPAFHFVPTAVGFYLYIKHTVLANFGLLDPDFGIGYEEENDLILRANKVGFRAVLANNAFAYHAGSASFGLLNINLRAHQQANMEKMAQRHPEFLPLVRRYEASAHFRAERLLGNLLPSTSKRLKIVFNLTSVGPDHNGTNDTRVAIIAHFCERHSATFDVSVVCTQGDFQFHRLHQHANLRRYDGDAQTPERFAIAVQLGQPFSLRALSTLEDLAVVNVFGMPDTMADDCGYLSVAHRLEPLWRHVARHANGVFFNSRFSEGLFIARYPDARALPRYARLLPTRLSCYRKPYAGGSADHVLIMGNHFPYKASDATAEIVGAAFPTVQVVALGNQNRVCGNVRTYRAGTLGDTQMESLFSRASVVVLPSYVEGFGLGLVHALAAGKVVVARDIPATREILSTYKRYSGVFLYANDSDVVRALRLAMSESVSHVDDDAAEGWNEWVDGFAQFCTNLLERDDVFERLERRIQAGDWLRKAELLERLQSSADAPAADTSAKDRTRAANNRSEPFIKDEYGRKWLPLRQINRLLALDGEEFVYSSYVTVLNRLPDSEGLVNYLAELESGISKLEIISRLRNSPEGRRTRMPLGGYRSTVLRARMFSFLGFARRSVANG